MDRRDVCGNYCMGRGREDSPLVSGESLSPSGHINTLPLPCWPGSHLLFGMCGVCVCLCAFSLQIGPEMQHVDDAHQGTEFNFRVG